MSEDLGPRKEIEAERERLSRLPIVKDEEISKAFPKGSLIPDPDALRSNTERFQRFLLDVKNVRVRFDNIYTAFGKVSESYNRFLLLKRSEGLGILNDKDGQELKGMKIESKLFEFLVNWEDKIANRHILETNPWKFPLMFLDFYKVEIRESIPTWRLEKIAKFVDGMSKILEVE